MNIKVMFGTILVVTVILMTLGSKLMKQQAKTITIGLAGDTMLGRMVNDIITAQGYAYPWGNIISALKSTAMNIVNLETTLTRYNNPIPKVFNFRADPDKIQSLIEGNITVVNIANNHILDFGPEGLIETMRTLKQAGIFYVGAGGNKAEATQPIIISTHGINIGIIGFTDNEPDWKAEQDKPGTNYIRVGNIEFLQKTIASLRLQADIIIVSAHWGPNMQEQPTQEFIDFAHKIIDCGTDIFHGHSAHIPQGIEIYHKKLILYDTGDFVDDYAIDERLHNDQSCFFIVTLDKSGLINVKLIPITIENMQANKAETAIHNVIMKRIKALSKQFETSIDDNDMIVIR